MSSPQQTKATTRIFARVFGPYLVIVTVTAVARASHMRTPIATKQVRDVVVAT